jgi:hypothetical protein
MTKFNDFLTPEEEELDKNFDKMQKINGTYGCQSCEKEAYVSYFDEQKGEMMWFCPEGHKSGFMVG